MNRKDLFNSLNSIDDAILERSETSAKKKIAFAWKKWGALAACLCLLLTAVIPLLFRQPAETPNDTLSPGDGPPSLLVNGTVYYISPYPGISETLPDGFSVAGNTSIWGIDYPYYTNPDIPEWVYVYQEVTTDGTLDESGTLNRTEPHGAYVRYVDARLRGRDLLCYHGEYYISMWSAQTYGSDPDVTYEYYQKMQSTYGIRIEGDAPEGFIPAGVTEFSGHDTIPRGNLVSNTGDDEVFVNPNDPNVILVATRWYSAPVGENRETSHKGFNVYIHYDCPFA